MIEVENINPAVDFFKQVGSEDSGEPIVLVNLFKVPPGKEEAFLTAWKDDAKYFKAQPGLIFAQMHRAIAGSGVFCNYAVWENLAAFRKASQNPELQKKFAAYPDGTVVIPHLYKKMAIEGICTA